MLKRRKIPAGEAEVVGTGEPQLRFQVESERFARLIVVEPKTSHQNLTVSPFILSSSIEDASNRNATLVVAISESHFSDIRNLGDESEWIPSKRHIVVMKAGTVRWIRPGIHHFKNLGTTTAKLVSIEW